MAARVRWGRALRGIALVALAALAVLLAGIDLSLAALRTSWGAERLRRAVLTRINSAIAGRLEMGRPELGLSRVTLHHVRLRDVNGDAVAEVDRLELRWSPGSLLEHRIEVSVLAIVGPRMWLRVLADGDTNLAHALATAKAAPPRSSAAGPAKPGWRLRLSGLSIRRGALTLLDERTATGRFRRLRIEDIGVEAQGRWNFSSSQGEIMLDVQAQATEPDAVPLHLHVDGNGSFAGDAAELDAGILAELGDSELRLWATALPAVPGPLGGKAEVSVDIERVRLGPALAHLLLPAWPVRVPVAGGGEARWNRETGEASARMDLTAGKLRLALAAAGDVETAVVDRLAIDAHAIDLAELVSGPPSDFSLAIAASGQAVRGGWRGQAVADVPTGRLDGHAMGPVHLRAEIDGKRARLAALRAVLPGLGLTAAGEATPERLNLRADVKLHDLGTTLASIGAASSGKGPHPQGSGEVHVRVAGSPARPALRLSADLAQLVWRQARVPRLRLSAVVPDLRRPLALDASLAVPEGLIGAHRVRDLGVSVHGSGPRMDATVALAEPVALHLASGGVWRHAGRELVLERLTLQLQGVTWALQKPALLASHEGRVRVRGFALAGQDGQSLHLDLDSKGKRLDAKVAVALALGRLPRALLPPSLRLRGRVSAQAELHRRGPSDVVDAHASLDRVRVGALPAMSLISLVRLNHGRITGSVDGSAGDGRLAAHVELPLGWPPPRNQAIVADIKISGVDLGEWFVGLRRKMLSLASGMPAAGGLAAVPPPLVLGGRADAHLVLGGTTTRPSVDLDGRVAGLRWNGVALGKLALRARGADGGPVEASLAVEPTGAWGGGVGRSQVEVRVDRAPAALLPSQLSRENLRTLPVHLRAHFDRLNLKALAEASRSPQAFSGWADANLVCDGNLGSPRGEADLFLDGVATSGVPPTSGKLHIVVDEHGGSLSAAATRRGMMLGSLMAHLAAPLRSWSDRAALAAAEVTLSASVGPLAFQHDALPSDGLHQPHRVLTGKVDGRLDMVGTLGNPRLTALVHAADVRLDGEPMGQASGALSYQAGGVHADLRLDSGKAGHLHGTAQIEHALSLLGRGAKNWGGAPLSARLEASDFDPAVLAGLSPRVRSVAGSLAAQIEVTGTVADPQPSGSVEWRGGEISASGVGEYRNVHLIAHGNRAQWALEELTADSGEGHARVHATGSRDDAAHAYRVTADVHAERLPAYVEGQALADVSLAAKAKAEVAQGRLRAQVDLESARLDLRDSKRKKLQKLAQPDDVVLVSNGKPLDRGQKHKLTELGTERAQATASARAAASEPTGPSTVVLLRGPRDLWVRGKDANVELGLDPGFRIEVGSSTRVYGRVAIKRGRVDVMGRRFDLKSDSSLRFDGDPALPELDVSAQHVNESENVTVLATVKGSPGHLTTSLTSTNRPDLTESQLYTLVVTGRLSLGGGSASASTPATQAETVLGGLLAGQLQKLVSKKLPFDVLTIEGGNTAGSARVEAGKYLTTDFYVGYVGRLGADPLLLQNRNAVHLEYEIGAHWSFQGEYGDAKTGSADMIWTKRY